MRLASIMRAPVFLLVGAVVAGATTAIILTADAIQAALHDQLPGFLAYLAASAILQLVGLKLPGGGTLSVSAVGLVGAAIVLGPGPAIAIGALTGLAQWLRSRGLAHRALFDIANLALASGAAALVFDLIADVARSGLVRLLAALLAGLAYVTVNIGLLCVAMALSEARSPLNVWRERFHFARFHFLAYGALGLLAASAYTQLGAPALLAFVLPPILLALSMRESLARRAATT
jgi:hypothetical protein